MIWRGTHKNTDLTLNDLFRSKLSKHFLIEIPIFLYLCSCNWL